MIRLRRNVTINNEMHNIIDLTLFLVKTLNRPTRYATTNSVYIIDNMKITLIIRGRAYPVEKYMVKMGEIEPIIPINTTMIISERMRDRNKFNLDIG